MTDFKNMQLVRDYWDPTQLRYLRPGSPLPKDVQQLKKMRELGYLKTTQEIQSERNPEAARAKSRVEQLEADLAQADAKIKALEERLTAGPQDASGITASALETLKGQLTAAQSERDEAIGALDGQKRLVVEAQSARAEAEDSLAEYRAAVGELLPEGLGAPARKALVDKGYVGKTLISLLTDEQLDAVPGVAAASIKTLREWVQAAEPTTSENAEGEGADAAAQG